MNKYHMSVEECGEYVSLELAEISVTSKVAILAPLRERLRKQGKDNQSRIVSRQLDKLFKQHMLAMTKIIEFLRLINQGRPVTRR